MNKYAVITGLSIAFTSAFCFTAPASSQETSATISASSVLAPADAYFGRFRMSVLGMRNAIKDVSIRIDNASTDDVSMLYHKLLLVEDAIHDLKDQYPQDSWLPEFGLSLAQAFAKIALPGAHVHANDNIDWLIAEYPTSDQAYYAQGMRRVRLAPVETMDVPIEPNLPTYAVPATP